LAQDLLHPLALDHLGSQLLVGDLQGVRSLAHEPLELLLRPMAGQDMAADRYWCLRAAERRAPR
jgi:hypothetical protein